MTATPERPAGRLGGSTLFWLQALLIFNTVLMLYPVMIMVFSAFRSTREIYSSSFGLPDFTNLANFQRILADTEFLQYLANSLIVTGGAVIGFLTFGTMAAYALARYHFRAGPMILLVFLAGLMVPLKLAVIPLFVQLKAFGLIDTRLGLIGLYTAMGLPSTVFIMTGFLRTLPGDLEDSARIDGASEPRIMWSIMLPLTRPALVIAAIYNAVPTWNDFFFPLVFIHTDARKTLPQGLTTFMGEFATDWGALFAGLTLSALPITLVYILLSRQFISGMTSGALK